MRKKWDSFLTGLVLVRLGQELGCDSPLSRAVFSLVEIAAKIASVFPVDRF
jgi:hypothetical protein